MSKTILNSKLIKAEAKRLGFLDCGIARATVLDEDAERLNEWLKEGMHGDMAYMEKHTDLRVDPRLLLENTRSVIIVLQNYFTKDTQADPDAPVISKYAYGKDYHKIVRKKLDKLLKYIHYLAGPVKGKIFVDSAPVLERAWARQAGLGWIGKNSLLLSRKYGSFFFLGGLLTDLELEYNKPMNEYCGSCTRCIDACPTGAIVQNRKVDSNRCISYYTIEFKGIHIPDRFRNLFENRVFGCDICQDICPWNHNAQPHQESGLKANRQLLNLTCKDWYAITEEEFNRVFEGSAVKRTKYSGIRRNLEFLKSFL